MSSSQSDKRQQKEPDREFMDVDGEDDEEAQIRVRLLARRAKQLKELIAAEPSDDPTMPKKSHHHHHKKKKRRHGSAELEEGETITKSSERLVSVASTVSTVVQSTDSFAVEEEGLNIKPPQAVSYQKKHKKRSRDSSPYYKPPREERTEERHHQQQHRPDSFDDERKRREKTDEGWSSWKRSLNKPSFYGRGGGPNLHGGGDQHGRNRSPGDRHGYRSKRTPPQSSTRWLPSKISSGSDHRPRSYVGDYHGGRGDKRREDEHSHASSERPSVKRGRGETEGAKIIASTVTSVGVASAALDLVTSPEATPTMDEVDDMEEKHIRKENSKEKKRSHGEPVSAGPPARAISRSSGSTTGKSNRSSMESGEHRSENEGDTAKDVKEKEVEMKKSKYSKFESSSESSSESDAEQDVDYQGRESEESDTEQDNGNHDVTAEASGTTPGADLLVNDVSPAPEFAEPLLPVYFPALMGCRSVEEFHSLNRIEEGTYGVVYRAKEKRTDEVVALKRLKMEKEKEGFPITSLREINMLLKAGKHPNICKVREIVVGSNMDKIYLVMDYVEHDLKSLMETMKQPFLIGEVKTLMKQLLAGVKYLHENWILHRDLKTSNLLLSHKGILKIADFGLAREYGSPLKPYTPVVVTLWYRAPELLLGIKEYSTPIDVWSVGCIFAEILTLRPLFTGKSEIEQLNKIFSVLGTPNDTIWPGYSELPGVKRVQFVDVKYNHLRKQFGATFSSQGLELMKRLFTYDPEKRITAAEALDAVWFKEEPRPVRSDLFPTWPAKSEQSKAPKKASSPKPPSGGKQFFQGDSDKDYLATLKGRSGAAVGGFSLKFDAPKF